MNKEKATLTLSKILAKSGYINIEKDSLIPYYLENSISSVLIKNSDTNKYYNAFVWEKCKDENYKDHLEKLSKNLMKKEKKLAKKIGANYLFISRQRSETNSSDRYEDLITAFALIGNDEIEELKDTLKGDLSKKVAEAAKELNIDISVDYIALLKTPDEFKKYFSAVSEKKQIAVVSDILKLKEAINPTITKWLEKDYAPILEHAGVTGVGKA